MPRVGSRFTKAELSRAMAAVQANGDAFAVEIALDGTIRLVPYQAPTSPPARKVEQRKVEL